MSEETYKRALEKIIALGVQPMTEAETITATRMWQVAEQALSAPPHNKV